MQHCSVSYLPRQRTAEQKRVVIIWIFTDSGFISIVVDKDDKSVIQVRSRTKEDIKAIFPEAHVYTANGADYRYRARVARNLVAVTLAEKVLDMDYTGHFKDVALRRSPKSAGRRDAYYACWTALGLLQDYAPYSKTPRDRGTTHVYPGSISDVVQPSSYSSDPGFVEVRGKGYPSEFESNYPWGTFKTTSSKINQREEARDPDIWDADYPAEDSEEFLLEEQQQVSHVGDYEEQDVSQRGRGRKARKRARRQP